MSWKDYFYFTTAQKIGIIILIVLIISVSLSIKLMPYFLKEETSLMGDSLFLAEVEQFKASLVEIDKKEPKRWFQYNIKSKRQRKSFRKSNSNKKIKLFSFNPNKADSITLCQLGIKPYVVKNILKYRKKGGKFRDIEHFSHTYGLSQSKFKQLKPYIHIQNENLDFQKKENKKNEENSIKINEKEEIFNPIDLNSVNVKQLQDIKGIGKFTANSIIHYREQLGGYTSVYQLKEVKGVHSDNFERIKMFFVVDTSKIEKINVNKASLERLKRHPYIRYFTKAKAIYNYRRYKIKLKNIEELEMLDELTAKDIKRLKPYLKFE